MRFKAPWSPLLIAVTMLISLTFIGIAVGSLLIGTIQSTATVFLLAPLPIALLIFVAYGYFIRGYSVTHDAVVVRRLARDISLPLAQLQSVEIDPTAMRWTWPMPNGGLFSFGGSKCRNRKLGWFAAYVTDFKRCVILRFTDRTVVISPSRPDAFVERVKSVQMRCET